MIPQDTIDRIFETVNIEDIVGDFVSLSKKGVNLLGLCPFHNEKTPSFTVSPAKGIYKCFGCGKGGNAINFLMEHKAFTYPEALKYAADKYGITIEEEKPSPDQEKKQELRNQIAVFNKKAMEFFSKSLCEEENSLALEYLRSRFSDEAIADFHLGFAPGGYQTLYNLTQKQGYKDEFLLKTGLFVKSKKNGKIYDFFQNRVIFPVSDRGGNIISFSGRILPGSDEKNAKYINLPETPLYHKSDVLYGIDLAISAIAKNKTAILVEGNPDAVKLHQLGISNVIAPSGTALADGQIKILSRFAEKILLLYDGDEAGQNALEKSGKILVEKGLIPYAAILPEKEDPESFFKDEKQCSKWIQENQTDFITWYSNKLFGQIGEDPSLKNDAINHVCELLMNVSSIKRQVYIDAITKASKIKAKLFSDRFKELEAAETKPEDKEILIPEGIDANDFERWGFYEYKNAYYFRTKNGNQKLSNFIMTPIFHIDSIIEPKRIYELVNEHGYSVVVNLDMNEMTSLQGFQRNVESKGNFMFWGQMAQFQKLKLKLYEETRTCTEVKNLGWQKEGFWAWSNGIIDHDGKFVPVDEYGIVRFDDSDYFIPAFSKIYLKDKTIFLDERKFQYKKSDIQLKTWMSLFMKVHGDNAMVAFAWYLSALFRDHILYLHDNFPILNLFGQKGSGKNTLAYSLLSLFGKKQTEYNMHNGTKPGLAKHIEMFRNAIAFLDEYKNNLPFDIIETLKSIYNAIGRSRLNMDKGGKKETTEVNQGVIVAGQEMPTVDIALSSRMIFLQFQTKDGLELSVKKRLEDLQEMERDGLSHFTVEFLKYRKYFVEFYKENYDEVMRKLVEKTEKEEINDRLLRNSCTVMAAFRTLEPKFDFTFSFDQLFAKTLDVIRVHNKQLAQSDEIGIFWNLMEAMFDDDLLIDNWHFKVSMMSQIKTTSGTIITFPDGKRILRFKFNAVSKLYAEQMRRRGDNKLPIDSLQHYLSTYKHFIGIEKSCKFTRKDFSSAEGKAIEKKQTTTAYCFDYNALGINLERFDIEAKEPVNGTSHSEVYSEPATVEEEDELDLPF